MIFCVYSNTKDLMQAINRKVWKCIFSCIMQFFILSNKVNKCLWLHFLDLRSSSCKCLFRVPLWIEIMLENKMALSFLTLFSFARKILWILFVCLFALYLLSALSDCFKVDVCFQIYHSILPVENDAHAMKSLYTGTGIHKNVCLHFVV